MTRWHVDETRDHVLRLFGREQLERARPSLNSVVDRQRYARYHFHEAIDLLKAHIDPRLEDQSFLHILLGGDDEQQSGLDLCLTKVGANVVACVQSIHAVADILAHASYFSLGLNFLSPPLPESVISLATVSARAKLVPNSVAVGELLESLGSGGDFAHLTALANHAKHRSIIRPSLFGDATGMAAEPYHLRFASFNYKGTQYPETPVQTLLEAEYNRGSIKVIEIGNAINEVLRTRAP